MVSIAGLVSNFAAVDDDLVELSGDDAIAVIYSERGVSGALNMELAAVDLDFSEAALYGAFIACHSV